MRRVTILLVLFSIYLNSYSQNRSLKVQKIEKEIGKNYLTNVSFKASEYIFPEKIYKSYIDTNTNLLTLQLRGTSKDGKWLKNKGHLVLFNVNSQKIRWSNKINYLTSNINRFNNTIIQTSANKSFCLNIYNGEKLWQVYNNIYFVDSEYNIGLGYEFAAFAVDDYTNNLEGINLSNGEKIWKREINRDYRWNDVFYINDSTLMIVAAGLHTINIKNGNGWDFNTITGKKDYSETAAANAVGMALGVFTGAFVMTTGYDLIRDIVSNVIIDSTYIYFTSKLEMACLNMQGEVLWSYPFVEESPSKSSIFLKDSMIYMVNKGYAFRDHKKLKFGTPFIAAFNKNTGKKEYIFTMNSNNMIRNFKLVEDCIILVLKNHILKYSLSSGSIIKEQYLQSQEYGELEFFLGNKVFIRESDSTFKSITLSDPNNNYLYTRSGNTFAINDNLEITKHLENKEFWIYYLGTTEYKFISKADKTFILNHNNKVVAELNVTKNAILIGSKLYDFHEQSFIEIDLRDLFSTKKY